MLHWLAGQKQPDGPTDPDATGYVEPPETPAPVFAVRAFKHAIFGTPQTVQPRPRRHSNVENARPAVTDSKSARPGIGRPKSSSDAPTVAKPEVYLEVEPLSSPTKGILLSPGTATARRKNVTFGENVVDNEEKRPLRSGTSEDSLANFPGGWEPSTEETKKRDESPAKGGRGRTKLSEALEQARDESKRKSKGDKRGKTPGNNDQTPNEHASPKSESGKYWKREYDIYRTNTQHEVKKLITKQKAAKNFAQMKDEQCTELATQLRQEQKKVEKLEFQTAELSSLVEALQNQLRASKDAEKSYKDEIAKLKGASRGARAKPTIGVPEPLFDHQRAEPETQADSLETAPKARVPQHTSSSDTRRVTTTTGKRDPVQRPSEPYNASALSGTEKSDKPDYDAALKADLDIAKATATDDIWAQSFHSSDLAASRAAEKAPKIGRAQQSTSSETNPNPLQSLDLNTLTSNSKAGRSSFEHQRRPASTMESSGKANNESEDASNVFQQAPAASARVSKLLEEARASQLTSSSANAETRPDKALYDPVSSSSQIDASLRPQRTAPMTSSTTVHSKPSTTSNTKENVPPDASSVGDLKAKPSAIWNSMNSPHAGKRNSSFTGKDGKEVSLDRIEAARARIAARSRGTVGT